MSDKEFQKKCRLLSILKGIFFILFGIALAFNMGYTFRTIAALVIFLCGIGIYLVAAISVFEGVFLIITGHMLLPNKKWKWFVTLIAFLAICMFASCIDFASFNLKSDIIRDYINTFSKYPGGWYRKEFINLFEVPFGGGFPGYLLTSPFIGIGENGKITAIIVSAVIMALSLFAVIVPHILEAHKKRKAYLKEHPEEVKAPKRKKEKKVKPVVNKYRNSFIKESDVYLHADEVGNDEVVKIVNSNDIAPVNFSNRSDAVIPDINNTQQFHEGNTLEKATLDLFGRNKKEEGPFVSPTVYPNVSSTSSNNISRDSDLDLIYEKEEAVGNYEDLSAVARNTDIISKREIQQAIKEEVQPQKEAPTFVEKQPQIIEKPLEVKDINNNPRLERASKPVVEIKHTKIDWVPPSTEALATYQTEEQVQANIDYATQCQETCNLAFQDFHIQASVVSFVIGPSVTRLLIDYPSTGSVKAVKSKIEDIARRLNGVAVRFAETVPGTPYSGLEIPNPVIATVSFKEIFEALPDAGKHPTAIAFGKDISNKVVSADVADFPHLLVSGTSGSGKSVFVNSIITTLIARTSPDDLKLVLVDPKRVEFNRYKEEPHLLCPVINEPNEAKVMLNKMVEYMNERYSQFEQADIATNIKEYNTWAHEHKAPTMPYIVIILDEYADLAYSCKEIGGPLVLICQKARACGIHVIVSTQRPSTDVITGTIKANLNTRVSLMAASFTDSMTILDEGGAEDLRGYGDMLVKCSLISRSGLTRLQGCYIQPSEINFIVKYLKEHYKPQYEERFLDLTEEKNEPATNPFGGASPENIDNDEEKYNWIKEWATMQEYVSMSKIQRECSVGFNRAGKIVRRLQDEGILSMDSEGSNRGFKVINGVNRFNDAPKVDSSEITNK